MTELSNVHRDGYLSLVPHYNSLFRYMDKPWMTPVMQDLITKSSLPFGPIETVLPQ